MVNYVRSPKQAAGMAGTVIPVISAVVSEEGQQPGPPLIADVEEREAVKQRKDRELRPLGHGVDEDIANAHADIGSRIPHFIKVTPHEGVSDYLQSHKEYESWNSEVNQVGHSPCSSLERLGR